MLEESKKKEADTRKELEKARAEKKKLEEEAEQKASKRRPSDPFRTPEDKIVRSGSAPLSAASATSGPESPASEPEAKKRKIQFGLAKFFGSPQEKASASPVSTSTDVRLRNRQQKSKIMFELEALRKQLANREQSQASEEEQLVQAEDEALDEKDFYRKAGLRGGRPKLDASERRGVFGSLASNRRGRFEKSKKVEYTAVDKKEICERFRKLAEESRSKKAALSELKKGLQISSERLRDILNNEAEWIQMIKDRRLGTSGLKKRGVKPGRLSLRNRGIRRKGGGRKKEFEHLVVELGRWISEERSHGHALQKAMVARKFEQLLLRDSERLLESARQLQASFQASAAKIEAQRMFQKAKKMANSEKFRRNYVERLLQWCGAKVMAKELTSNLSALEEKVRIQLSWQSLDWQLWLAGSAPKEVLEEEDVLDPDYVIECRKLGPPPVCFADQIPLWAKCGSKRFVFSAEEFSGSSTSDRAQFELFRQDLQKAVEYFRDLEEKDKTQLISAEPRPEGSKAFAIAGSRTIKGHSENEKFRITFEARQQVSWVPDPNAAGGFRPVGSVLRPLLVFAGAHCRLSNLTDEHTFRETEDFQVNGQDFQHVAGQKTRLMWNLVELRKKEPQLFEDLEIQQQPSSNVDSVILTWSIQEQAKVQAYSVWNRDSFTAIFSEPVIQTQKLASQFSSILLGKTTQKIQLTDTDFAKEMKVEFRKAMQDLQYDKGFHEKTTLRDILVACNQSHLKAVERNIETQWVLKGAVRNGLLAYVPTVENGLVEILSPELQLGSHRIPSETFQPRLSWIDESGRPKKPDFSLSGQVSSIQDCIEWSFQNPVKDEPENQLDIEGPLEDDLAIPLQNALYLRLSPSLRNDFSRAKLDVSFAQLQEKAKAALEKKNQKREQRTALRKLNLKELQARLKKMSKGEAMQEIKPVVKTKKAIQKRGAVKVSKGKLSLQKKLKKTKAKFQLEKDAKAMVLKDKLEEASEKAPTKDSTTAEKVSEAAKASAKGRGRAAGKGRGKGRGKGAATASAEASDAPAEASAEASAEEKISALLPAGIKKEPVQVRAVSEEAGKVYFGFEGEVEKQEFETKGKEDFIHVYGSKVLSVKVQWLQKIDATWSKPTECKKFTSLSRFQAASILDTAGLRPEPFVENTDAQGFRKGCTKKKGTTFFF